MLILLIDCSSPKYINCSLLENIGSQFHQIWPSTLKKLIWVGEVENVDFQFRFDWWINPSGSDVFIQVIKVL